MAISFVAAGAVQSGSNPTVPVPSGFQQADLLVLAISCNGVAPTTPTGWTAIVSYGINDPRIYIFYKFALGTETNLAVTVSSATASAVMLAYRGVSATDTISTALNTTSTSISTNAATLTTTYANEYIISVYASSTTALTWTAPASTTSRVNSPSSASNDGLLIVDELQAAAGVSTSRTATTSVSAALSAVSFSVVPSGRYWVGGTGTWDTTTKTVWSFSSGGAGGAPVPTAQDNVYFDQAATYTVTTTGVTLACLNFTISAGTVTFSNGGTLGIFGSYSVTSSTVWSGGGAVNFSATSTGKTITTNGVSFTGSVGFNGIGGGWTLGSAFTTTQNIVLTAGTLNTAGYNLSTTTFTVSNNSNVKGILLNSSTVTLSSTTPIQINTLTGLTFNAGTSQINSTFAGAVTFAGGGATFYNVAFTSTIAGLKTITGVNTFNNLSVTGPSAGTTPVTFDSKTTINGTLSTTGTAGNRRVFFASSTYGISLDLVINSAPSLTDADFRNIYVTGSAAPISGTRIGNRGMCKNITFDAPKTVYWNLAGTQNWSANGWCSTSGGTPNTNNFPLPQDTAVFNNTGSITTISLDTAIGYISNVDFSTRTTAVTVSIGALTTSYGNWTNGSGVTISGTSTLTMSGIGSTQTITSAGKTFSNPFTIDSYEATVLLGDAFSIGSATNSLVFTNGTFNTQGYSLTAAAVSSSTISVRVIRLGASTVTLGGVTPISFSSTTGLTFDAGTSQINCTYASSVTFNAAGINFYNVALTATASTVSHTFSNSNTFNNLSIAAPTSAGYTQCVFASNSTQTINGSIIASGSSSTRRVYFTSSTIGTPTKLIVNSLSSASDCDFRDITITGNAAGSTPTRAGDCGGNSGITFPAPKTVYWNTAGASTWSSQGWAATSGGTTNANNFPLAQDTAVFNNGAAPAAVNIDFPWNIGTIDTSAQTNALTLSIAGSASGSPVILGDCKLGTGITFTTGLATLGYTFAKRGTQTITSGGISFVCNITIGNGSNATIVQLADAFSMPAARTLSLVSGTFDAVSYNVTIGQFQNTATTTTLKMGSGTWTLSGTGAVWNISSVPAAFYKGTANIILSDTSTTARTFAGGGLTYNKVTIGGTTGTSTTTFSGNDQYTEFASTKTVAHTIALGTTTPTYGKWSITGTSGNVVSVTGTASITIAGARVSGVDYLGMGTTALSATSPGEFYAGANSTGTGSGITLTAAPSPVTRYWVGGNGTWDATTTTNWSTASGGTGGASVPTSADTVIFDNLSSASSYTVTCTATQLRCGPLTFSAPASGTVTWAGSAPMAIHGNFMLPATGLSRSFTGNITFSGSTLGNTITTNGVALSSSVTINGVGCGWVLGSAINIGGLTAFTLTNGSFDTSASSYSLTAGSFSSSNWNSRSLTLNASSIASTITGTYSYNFSNSFNLTLNAGTSTLNSSATGQGIITNLPLTFYDYTLGSAGSSIAFVGPNTFHNVTINGVNATVTFNNSNIFNNLYFAGKTAAGIKTVTLYADQTVNGTLTFDAGTNSTMRTSVKSNTFGTKRTINCAAISLTDVDFQDIAITGAAAPASGTRIGDGGGNSGITFSSPKTVYWSSPAGGNWNANAWANSSGGTPDANSFPLAQDTAVFDTAGLTSGSTVTYTWPNYVGNIDTSAFTTNTMTLALSTNLQLTRNWVSGSGLTITNSSLYNITFMGRNTQTIRSGGILFPYVTINSPGGTVRLLDAFQQTITSLTYTFNLSLGTLDTNGYSFTIASFNSSTGGNIIFNSSPWTVAGTYGFTNSASTVGGTTIKFTAATISKSAIILGSTFSSVILDQAGSGPLGISPNSGEMLTLKNITNSYSATNSTTISLGTSIITLTNPFAATGAAGKILTFTGTSATSPAAIIYSGSGVGTTNIDYLSLVGIRVYNTSNTWYAGANSTNLGSLGWIFSATPYVPPSSSGNFLIFF